MLSVVEQALRAHRAASDRESPWVFRNRDGGPLDLTNLRERVWRPALRRGGLRARTLYQTRATFATLMLELGESPGWVAQQLGHTQRRDGLPPVSPLHSEPAWSRRNERDTGPGRRGAVRPVVVTRWSLETTKGLRVSP
jgi:hypothetical protein